MQSVNNSRLSGEYLLLSLLGHVLIRHYLTTGRKYGLNKRYALTKHVHLLSGLYGIYRQFASYGKGGGHHKVGQ